MREKKLIEQIIGIYTQRQQRLFQKQSIIHPVTDRYSKIALEIKYKQINLRTEYAALELLRMWKESTVVPRSVTLIFSYFVSFANTVLGVYLKTVMYTISNNANYN